MTAFRTEQHFEAPRPLFLSLESAVRACIREGNIPGEINHTKWAETYRTTSEEVRAEFIRAETKIPPCREIGEIGEGK